MYQLNPTTPSTPSTDQPATPAQASTNQPQDLLIAELRQQIADLRLDMDQKLTEAQRTLQGASYRNGYLEAQLAQKETEIKFLDRQPA